MTPQADCIFGMRPEDDVIFIRNAPVTFEGNGLVLGGTYKGSHLRPVGAHVKASKKFEPRK